MAGICREQPGDDNEKLVTMRRLRPDYVNLTDFEMASIFSNYGWIYVEKITNNSDNNVHFYNPYLNRSGDISPGKSDTCDSTGYLPLYDCDKRYELKYKNTKIGKEKKILMKDLDGDWLASFYQDENEEDVRDVTPEWFKAFLTIVFTNNGYDVYESGTKKGGIFWQ